MAAAYRRHERPPSAPREVEAPDDREDVPAAVVCVLCGAADCTGCDSDLTRSGLVAVVPWERPLLPLLSRLWLTARSTTRDADRFFEGLPDGALLPAVRFAFACELVASVSMLAAVAPLVALVTPRWIAHVMLEPSTRDLVLRVLLVSVPALALLMVFAHVTHGLALEWGARRSGARPALRRALRFGLYSAGWDLMLGPVGLVGALFETGWSGPFELIGAGMRLPSRSSQAFLRGVHRLEGAPAKRALRAGSAAAAVVTVLGALLVLSWGVFLAFL